MRNLSTAYQRKRVESSTGPSPKGLKNRHRPNNSYSPNNRYKPIGAAELSAVGLVLLATVVTIDPIHVNNRGKRISRVVGLVLRETVVTIERLPTNDTIVRN